LLLLLLLALLVLARLAYVLKVIRQTVLNAGAGEENHPLHVSHSTMSISTV